MSDHDRKAEALNALDEQLRVWSLEALKRGVSTQTAGEAQLLIYRLAETSWDAIHAGRRLGTLIESLPEDHAERISEIMDRWGEEYVDDIDGHGGV